jgi:MORN repeat
MGEAAGLDLFQIIFRGAIAIAVWYALSYGLSEQQNSPAKNGRRVGAWLAAAVVFSAAQSSNRTAADVAYTILITAPFWYLFGFVGGYVWRKMRPLNASAVGSPARTAIQVDSLIQADAPIQHVAPDEQHWAAALTEFDSDDRRAGLWARVYAEAQGNEASAKANYLKARATELYQEQTRSESALSCESSAAREKSDSVTRSASQEPTGIVTLVIVCLVILAVAGTLWRLNKGSSSCSGSYNNSWTNCYGEATFSKGDKYVGEFTNGKHDGQGTYIWGDGRSYVGTFKNFSFTGQGTEYRADGSKLRSRNWENDVLVGNQ